MLYKEASRILQLIQEKKGTLKNLVLSSKYRNKKQLYAIVCETLKYKPILTKILENTQLQKREKILKQEQLARVLLYDFLLGKGFTGHTDKFKDAVLNHKAALQSELARIKVKTGAETNDDLLPSKIKHEAALPRYVRVNTLKRPVQDVVDHFRKDGFTQIHASATSYDVYIDVVRSLKKKTFLHDPYIAELLVFATGTDLHDHVLYKTGEIIFQDKASCIPAFALAPPPGSHVIDCCAAPGNKTSYLAAIMQNKGKLYAFDKDMKRAATLSTMLLKAGVLCASCRNMDFLRCDPNDPEYKDVQYILVDPSCSGSGITNRLNDVTDDEESISQERLEKLAKFQMAILRHAMSFPMVKKVVYSTCSIHQIENENVVNEALKFTRNQFKLVAVMKNLPNRGQKPPGACGSFKAKRCLRLNPSNDLSNGFFVALFERIADAERSVKDMVQKSNVCVSDQNGITKTHKNEMKQLTNTSQVPFAEATVTPTKKHNRQKEVKIPSKGIVTMEGNKQHILQTVQQQVTKTSKKRAKITKLQSRTVHQPQTGKNKKKKKNRKHKPVTA